MKKANYNYTRTDVLSWTQRFEYGEITRDQTEMLLADLHAKYEKMDRIINTLRKSDNLKGLAEAINDEING